MDKEQYDQHRVEQGIAAALEIFQASRSISLGVAAKAKAESGRREL